MTSLASEAQATPAAIGPPILLALMAPCVAVVALGVDVTPFHYMDALAVVTVAVGPALLVLAWWAGSGGRIAASLAAGQNKQAMSFALSLGVLIVLAPGNVALWANEKFDRSPAVVVSTPVTDMWTRRWRYTTHHFAGVAVNVPSPLGRNSFYGPQPIEVTRAAYGDLVPGRSRFVLRTHRGALGFPWFEPKPQQVD